MLLGEENIGAASNLEHATAARDQPYRVWQPRLLELSRQTGGSLLIPSRCAIFNRDFNGFRHGNSLSSQMYMNHSSAVLNRNAARGYFKFCHTSAR